MHVAESVDADTELSSHIIPDDGTKVILKRFESNLPPLKDTNVCVIWDYGGSGETIIATQNILSGVVVGTGDGIKKLALLLSNNELGESVVIGADCLIEELTNV